MSDVILKIDNDLKLKIVQQNVVLKFFNSVTIENVINVSVIEALLLSLDNFIDEPTAFATIGPNKLFWTSGPENDVEFPYTLKKTRSA
jgi:hypothetical protein